MVDNNIVTAFKESVIYKISSLISSHNSSSSAHSDIRSAIPSANTNANNIQMDGVKSAGTGTAYARANHVHPSDISKENLASKINDWEDLDYDSYPDANLVKDTIDGLEYYSQEFDNTETGTFYNTTEDIMYSILNEAFTAGSDNEWSDQIIIQPMTLSRYIGKGFVLSYDVQATEPACHPFFLDENNDAIWMESEIYHFKHWYDKNDNVDYYAYNGVVNVDYTNMMRFQYYDYDYGLNPRWIFTNIKLYKPGYLKSDVIEEDYAKKNHNHLNLIDSAGTGLSKNGTTLNHSNNISALTTASLKKIKYDAQGHITGSANVTASDLPSHTHSQYLTTHQSLEDYYTKTEIDDLIGDIQEIING